MAGIFDFVNGGSGTGAKLTQFDVAGALIMRRANLRTGNELLAAVNGKIGSLNSAAIADFQDILAYIDDASDENEAITRLNKIQTVLAIYETGFGNLTETEARSLMGVNWR